MKRPVGVQRTRGASGPAILSSAILLLLTLLTSLVPAPAAAQAVYGSISGTVKDASGGVLPGVTVTITSVERKTTDSVLTNDSGLFIKERLLPGAYEVKAELSGFKTALVPRVDVSVDTQTPVDLTLEVGEVAEQITVTGGSTLLTTDRADVATRFDTKQITDLPVLDRNFTKFVLLTPGTQQLQWQHAASENPQGSTQTMVNGQHFSGTTYQLDGTENRDPILGIIVINPTLESIQETKITSQNYDAEFGQATAGVVSVQTKSGTNSYRGSLFEFFLSDRFQSRNPFTQFQPDPITGEFLPETKRNQFGGSIGGPIVENKWFFFGDYQGTRFTQGGSRLLSVPTDAARAGDLRAYGVNIYDPLTGQQFPNNVIPTGRLSAQAQNILALIPRPNAPGRDNGTRDNFVVSNSEAFEENSINVRVDGRLSDTLNAFARYSLGDFFRDGPTAFGPGGGQEIVSLGGVSDVRNQSVAIGVDRTFSDTLLGDFRFGFFKYKVNVLPFDFGTTPARDAGIPGLNLDDTFSSGLPAGFIDGEGSTEPGAFEFGSGLGVNRCNCPLDQDEKQFQIVGNLTKFYGNHSFKFGIDVRRAYNLRVPSDSHRSGELTFASDRTSLAGAGGLGLATFLIGDVTNFRRYVSPNTDARERQWRHFYYAQDTWRVNDKLTLNYGLRLDVINPQTINEPGNAGFLDLDTGEIKVVGIGGIGMNGDVENRLNWAPRVGATYQIDEKTVLRAGYGRSYDIGVFGSLFGHSVTQNLPVLSVQELRAPSNFDRVFTLASGPPDPVFPEVPSDGTFPLPDGVFTRALPEQQRPPAVDAFNVIVQRQISDTMSFEIGYVGNRGDRVFAGDGPAFDINQATLNGYPSVPRNNRRPFFNKFGWTQGIDFFCNCATNSYHSLQAKFNKRFSDGYSAKVNYTWQRVRTHDGQYFEANIPDHAGLFDSDLNYGPPDWDRIHNFVLSLVAEIPVGRGKRYMSDVSTGVDALIGGWQFNTNLIVQSGLPFNVTYAGAGADRDTGPNRPDLIGDPDGPQTQQQWFNSAPIGAAGSAFGRPAAGTFGNLERNLLRGPGYWRTDASLFKHIELGQQRRLEFRIEVVNLFNHVNLGNPDSEIGAPGESRPNAGRINSTAYFNADPQRNFQFALKFSF
jgi:Carboxypeptidase regulatory-like domain/TonB dependent receptor-like, beta-barrel